MTALRKPSPSICQCEPYRPCAACEAITDLEVCDVCHEAAYSWPRCTACGTVDEIYLHDRVKLAMSPRSELNPNHSGAWFA